MPHHMLRSPALSRLRLALSCLPVVLGIGCAGTPAPASRCVGAEEPATRVLLQQTGPHGAMLRFRGEARTVCVGTDPDRLELQVAAAGEGSHRQALLEGLRPDTVYYYSIGGATRGKPEQWFRTAPLPDRVPRDGNTHIWILGDSGTASEQIRGRFTHPGEAELVRDGFLRYNREQADGEALDLLLLLGDNAYLEGTDAQWQAAFFDVYPEIVRNVPVWPTIGNHEMGAAKMDVCQFLRLPQCAEGPVVMPMGGASDSPDPASYDSNGDGPDAGGLPYLDIFALPTAGELGGVPSGTEQYYSFDHGNLHVVSLDSQLSNRDPSQRAAMRAWLIADLQANRRDWTIVIFHHPPYSKGVNHDSDLEQTEIDMRGDFAPVFDEYGVDVVYSGHSHSYERSWYLHGHYGPSSSFDARQHAELDANGKPALGQDHDSYHQVRKASGSDDSVVYTVAGSSGKADHEKPCPEGQIMYCTRADWLAHPAHRDFDPSRPGFRSHGIALRGSVVLDVTRDSLRSRFIDEHGEVLDEFTIRR